MTNEAVVRGGCLCGAVRFELRLPSKWCAHCHCSMCRRAHGAGYVTWAGFESDHFELVAGDHHLEWYRSSEGARRGFCRSCGSSMLFESDRWPQHKAPKNNGLQLGATRYLPHRVTCV